MMPGIASTRRVAAVLLLAALSMLPVLGHAACTITGVSQTILDRSAQIVFGRINLTDTYLQPAGTLLATTTVPPTQFTYNGANADSVLWICDATDLPRLHFLVATNGVDRVGGRHEIGLNDGLPGVYATWLNYVGLKLTMPGVTLNDRWQRIELSTYVTSGDKIEIRLRDIPVMQAELYRVSTPVPSGGTELCFGAGSASSTGTVYSCNMPNAYVQLSGPGIIHDIAGETVDGHVDFWFFNNGFGYGMRQGTILSQVASCVARNATSHVLFPTVSVQQLQNGVSVQANFSVEVECSNSAKSGTGSGQTALGIQVSPGAYLAAKSPNLGLVNASGGVRALVSDNYGKDGFAQGVGITLKNASTGSPMVFVGQPGFTGSVPSPHPAGEAAGWYPVLRDAIGIGSVQSGYTKYRQTFTATLQKLDSLTNKSSEVTPGKVYATAYVLVKVQ